MKGEVDNIWVNWSILALLNLGYPDIMYQELYSITCMYFWLRKKNLSNLNLIKCLRSETKLQEIQGTEKLNNTTIKQTAKSERTNTLISLTNLWQQNVNYKVLRDTTNRQYADLVWILIWANQLENDISFFPSFIEV